MLSNVRTFKVEFTHDDGYGGIYPCWAEVSVAEANRKNLDGTVEVVLDIAINEMEGPIDQDGGEISRLQSAAEEQAMEAAGSEYVRIRVREALANHGA
jgi:hypothetical protein